MFEFIIIFKICFEAYCKFTRICIGFKIKNFAIFARF